MVTHQPSVSSSLVILQFVFSHSLFLIIRRFKSFEFCIIPSVISSVSSAILVDILFSRICHGVSLLVVFELTLLEFFLLSRSSTLSLL